MKGGGKKRYQVRWFFLVGPRKKGAERRKGASQEKKLAQNEKKERKDIPILLAEKRGKQVPVTPPKKNGFQFPQVRGGEKEKNAVIAT